MPNVSIQNSGPARAAIGRAARSNPQLATIPEDRVAAAIAHILSEHEPQAAKQAAEILAKAAGPRTPDHDLKRTKESMEKAMFAAVLEEAIEQISSKPYFHLESAIAELMMSLDHLRNPQSKPNQNLIEAMEHMQHLQQMQQTAAGIGSAMHDVQMSAIQNLRR